MKHLIQLRDFLKTTARSRRVSRHAGSGWSRPLVLERRRARVRAAPSLKADAPAFAGTRHSPHDAAQQHRSPRRTTRRPHPPPPRPPFSPARRQKTLRRRSSPPRPPLTAISAPKLDQNQRKSGAARASELASVLGSRLDAVREARRRRRRRGTPICVWEARRERERDRDRERERKRKGQGGQRLEKKKEEGKAREIGKKQKAIRVTPKRPAAASPAPQSPAAPAPSAPLVAAAASSCASPDCRGAL